MKFKKKLLLKKLERVVEGDISRLSNTEEMMIKINEIIDIINENIKFNIIKVDDKHLKDIDTLES